MYLVEFNGTGKWSFGFQGSEKNKIIFEDKKVKLFKDDDKVTFYLAYKKIFEEDTNIDYVCSIISNLSESFRLVVVLLILYIYRNQNTKVTKKTRKAKSRQDRVCTKWKRNHLVGKWKCIYMG